MSIAMRMAHDRARLADFRETMRRSPLLDATGFTREMEAAYRAMWQVWCAGDPTATVAGKYGAPDRW